MKRRRRMSICLFLGVLLGPPPSMAQEESDLKEVVEVVGSWELGDKKSYTFIFEQAPLGRLEITLENIRFEEGQKILTFTHEFWLAAEGLGQKGRRAYTGSIDYSGRIAEHLRMSETITRWETYRNDQPLRPENVQREIERKLGSLLIDIELVGHLERLLINDPLAEGDEREFNVSVVPRDYDYLIDSLKFSLDPEEISARLQVEGREDVALFGNRELTINAFRCTIPGLGYTLWVSEGGALLKFDNGNHLLAYLEY